MKIYLNENRGSHNIAHFLMNMCIPIYVAMEREKVFGKNPTIIIGKNNRYNKEIILPEVLDLFTNNISYVDSDKRIKDGKIVVVKDGKTITHPGKLQYDYCKKLSKFILKGFKIKTPPKQTYILLVDRTGPSSLYERSIVNKEELHEGLKEIGIPVRRIQFGTISFEEQLKLVQGAKILISNHGASLTNMLFLQPGAGAIEILPYGWTYRRYAKIAPSKGMGIKYLFWRNEDKSKSIINYPTHFDTSILPLNDPSIIRNKDKTGVEYEKAVAIKNYYQHQSTIVDVKAIKELAEKLL